MNEKENFESSKPTECIDEMNLSKHKTPEKNDKHEHGVTNNTNCNEKIESKTPEKVQSIVKNGTTHTKDGYSTEKNTLKTPEKVVSNCNLREKFINENTPQKVNNIKYEETNESEMFSNYEGEEGMISTTEQARLLIAASKTPSKSTNKTPIKAITPSSKIPSGEDSPITPGKHKRVELITLSSPKTKRFKQL